MTFIYVLFSVTMWYWPLLYCILVLELPGLVSSLKTVINKMAESPFSSMNSSQSDLPHTGSDTGSEDRVWLKDLKTIHWHCAGPPGFCDLACSPIHANSGILLHLRVAIFNKCEIIHCRNDRKFRTKPLLFSHALSTAAYTTVRPILRPFCLVLMSPKAFCLISLDQSD